MLSTLNSFKNFCRSLKSRKHQLHHKKNTLKSIPTLQRIVKGKNVVILGSGPSLTYFTSAPKDFVIGGCNLSPHLAVKDTPFQLYATNAIALEKDPLIQEIYTNGTLTWIMSDLKEKKPSYWYKDYKSLREFQTLFDQDYLLKNIKALSEGDQLYFYSTGVQLLLMCFLAGANAVYTAGIDSESIINYHRNKHYKDDPKKKHNQHFTADNYALQQLLKNNFKLYSLDPHSLTLPYKALPPR